MSSDSSDVTKEDLRQLNSEKEQLQSEVAGLRAELEQLQNLSENQKSDILSLQLLVNETVEASATGFEEQRKLRQRCADLEQQLAQLRHQQDVSIAPATLVRSLARKLGADSEDQPPKKPVEEGEIHRYETELTALKNKLRDTDSQLQEALKSKTTNVNVATSSSGDTRPDPEGARACDMCNNYEKQLVLEQREAAAARERRDMLEQALKLATEELEGARSIHEETIRSWHAERAASTTALEELRAAVDGARSTLADSTAAAHQASQRALQQVTTLTVQRETLQRQLDRSVLRDGPLEGLRAAVDGARSTLADSTAAAHQASQRALQQVTTLTVQRETLQRQLDRSVLRDGPLEGLRAAVDGARSTLADSTAAAHQASQRALQQVTTLTVQRETLQRQLDSLECDNAMLIGRFTKKAEEMQSEFIDLPDSVEELQLCMLELREQLICVQIGREEALAAERDLRGQLVEHAAACQRQDTALQHASQQLQHAREELERLATEREQLQELGGKLRQSNDTINSLLDDKKRMLGEVAELRARVSALQQELDNSEKVQQDFVRLSQSLQVQLQRIREADTEVRWQHDEDVTSCPSCHVALPNTKKKVHCRHCGRIFCAACAAHTVASGPRRAPARVCAVCRTLLQPHTAPYFSTAPPHTPD
ncbi:rab GTPase-binding effector protein rabaptin-5 isoform X2 [Choristoneura fumiferana]|uniref:rab GTPase-binding effector protein rabaptin-5 isoform X2 n=1 Tax=Choristoneura fumiferana TaxID=7141 RepID=UPI003D15A47D